jgi:hypothetical protein
LKWMRPRPDDDIRLFSLLHCLPQCGRLGPAISSQLMAGPATIGESRTGKQQGRKSIDRDYPRFTSAHELRNETMPTFVVGQHVQLKIGGGRVMQVEAVNGDKVICKSLDSQRARNSQRPILLLQDVQRSGPGQGNLDPAPDWEEFDRFR